MPQIVESNVSKLRVFQAFLKVAVLEVVVLEAQLRLNTPTLLILADEPLRVGSSTSARAYGMGTKLQ